MESAEAAMGTAVPVGGRVDLEDTDCPLCGGADFALVQTARELMFGTQETFNIVRCKVCRHVFVNPRPGPDDILRYYPADYGPHHNLADAPENSPAGRPWYLSRVVKRIPGLRRIYYWLTDSRDVLIPSRPENPDVAPRALELGCSDGDYLIKLQERGWDVVGVEPAAAPTFRAQARGLDVKCGVLEPGDFPEASFDAVCAWHVLEHLHEPRDVVREIARITKPGGELLLSLPNYGCWEPHVFGEYWYVNQPPIHLQHFTPRSLRSLLDSCGFEIVTCEHQRNLSNVVGSVALWLRSRKWAPRLAERLLRYPDRPSLRGQLLLALPAKVLAFCRQGGRLTVRARRRISSHPIPISDSL